MRQYSRLLENFNVNDEMVNDCIFTMMHHIAGDLRNVNVLLQPSILRVFLRIWREGFELCGVSVCSGTRDTLIFTTGSLVMWELKTYRSISRGTLLNFHLQNSSSYQMLIFGLILIQRYFVLEILLVWNIIAHSTQKSLPFILWCVRL